MSLNSKLIIPISKIDSQVLTMENLYKAGVRSISYCLGELLIKPGFKFLSELNSLQDYVKWPGEIILNSQALGEPKFEKYIIRSPYDGSFITITKEQVFKLLVQLKPEKIILPYGFEEILYPELTLAKVYYSREPSYEGVLYELKDLENKLLSSYILHSATDISELKKAAFKYSHIETDLPLRDGVKGIVYLNRETKSILAKDFKENFELLDTSCKCSTCSKDFTRAYLHHLYQQTPLLAQRYLCQHNIFFLLHLPKNEIPL